jgi:bifunctional non-homologous end joining protein LigD
MGSDRQTISVSGRRLEVSNLAKIFYPATKTTKKDVLDYYRAIAPVLLPHLRGRPVTLKRYPDGVDGGFFYEKRCPPHRPEWVKTVSVRRKRDNQDIPYCLLDTVPALLWATNLANLELHANLGRGRSIERPTSLVFDLDPGPPAGIIKCGKVALRLREYFSGLGLESYCKTSGSKGLQVYVPLNTAITYDTTRPLAHEIATELENEMPKLVVSRMAKELRTGKVLIDWSQNDAHKTTVCVYSLRAVERPSVSTPVTWDELEASVGARREAALRFGTKDVLERVERNGDLFEPVAKLKQKLPR